MNKKRIYIVIIMAFFIISLLNINTLHAQVTIGANTEPEEFSILQLENVAGAEKGFRLPRLSQAQCQTLKSAVTGKQPANGLVVYNTDTNTIQYWNGTDWIPIDYKNIEIVAENGVKFRNSANPYGGIELGGDLNNTAGTTVSMGTNSLSFPVPVSNPGSTFTISSANDFIVTNEKIGIGTSSPNVKLEVNSATEGALRISGSGEAPDYLLTSDANGNATWQPLKPLSSIVMGNIYNNYSFNKSQGQDDPRISDNMTLGKGKWLIMGKFTATRTTKDTASKVLYTYVALKYRDSFNQEVTATIVGSLPEQDAYNSGLLYSTPQFFYYVELDNPRTFYITAGTSASESPHNTDNRTTTEYGGSHFYALRIDNKN